MVWFQINFPFMYGLVWFWGGSQTIDNLIHRTGTGSALLDVKRRVTQRFINYSKRCMVTPDDHGRAPQVLCTLLPAPPRLELGGRGVAEPRAVVLCRCAWSGARFVDRRAQFARPRSPRVTSAPKRSLPSSFPAWISSSPVSRMPP
jgi:hypothetical protein